MFGKPPLVYWEIISQVWRERLSHVGWRKEGGADGVDWRERKLEFEEEFGVDLSTGEVIGDGVLLGGDIGDPVVAVDVADAE